MVAINLSQAFAVTLINPGFNDQSGWATDNDAVLGNPGGVAPWEWVTPVVASVVVQSSETVLPFEGTGMGLTYAGLDSFKQIVNIPTPGEYEFSIYANALSGDTNFGATLVNGRFVFLAGGAQSPNMTVATVNGWEKFSWTTFLDAGNQVIGIENNLAASYAIAYDSASLKSTVIPIPAAAWLFGSAMLGLIGYSRRKCQS
ncbi:MAG: hypothetical protein AAF419_04625 [Pseudomonadota bacterium]